jgi:hypothetical protein
MAEDDTLYTPFLDNISYVLAFSDVPVSLVTLSAGVGTGSCVCPCREQCARVVDVLLSRAFDHTIVATTTTTTTTSSSNTTNNNDLNSSSRSGLDVFVVCLPMLLDLTDEGNRDQSSSSSSKKLMFSSTTLLPLLLSSTVSLLEDIQGKKLCDDFSSLRQLSTSDMSSLSVFDELINYNRAISVCFMCVQLFGNIMCMKVEELYGSSKSLSKVKKQKLTQKLKSSQRATATTTTSTASDERSFSDEMVTEYLGITASMSDIHVLLHSLSVCVHSSGDIFSIDSDDSDDDIGEENEQNNHNVPIDAEFEGEIKENHVILQKACGELFAYFQKAYSAEFITQATCL